MTQFQQKLTPIYKGLVLCLFVLINCNIYAYQVNGLDDFSRAVKQIEQLKDQDLSKAYDQLVQFESQLPLFPILKQVQYYKLLAEIYTEMSKYQLAKDAATQGLETAKALKSPDVMVADLSYSRGFALENLGYPKLAAKDYLNGLDLAESIHNQLYVAQGLINLGALYYQKDQYDRSLIMFNDALKIANSLNDDELKGYIYTELGILYAYMGERQQSYHYYQLSYDFYQKANKPMYALNALSNIGIYYLDIEAYDKAIKTFKKIIATPSKLMSDQFYYSAYSGLAWAYNHKKTAEPEVAYQYILIAGQYLASLEQASIPFNYLMDKANTLKNLKRYDEAMATLFDAEKLLTREQKQNNDWNYLLLMNARAELLYSLGRYKSAYQLKSDYYQRVLKVHANENNAQVQNVRLRFESEQADIQKQILEQQRSLQNRQLNHLQESQQQQKRFIAVSVVALLVLLWILVKLIRGQKQLLLSSRTDALTGIANRHRLLELGNLYFSQARKAKLPLSVMMLDIDKFKAINDKYGHKTGDQVLQQFVAIIQKSLRAKDIFARYGGEEFTLVLPETNLDQAIAIGNRLLTDVQTYQWQQHDLPKVTVSIGVAALEQSKTASFSALIDHADALLYQAKSEGRNKLCC